MGFKETRTYLEKCISRTALAALSAPPPGVINCVCVCKKMPESFWLDFRKLRIFLDTLFKRSFYEPLEYS